MKGDLTLQPYPPQIAARLEALATREGMTINGYIHRLGYVFAGLRPHETFRVLGYVDELTKTRPPRPPKKPRLSP